MFENAPCVTSSDPDLWFSDRPSLQAKAKRLCAVCPVVAACAKLGESAEFGIFGGKTARERRGLAQVARQESKDERNAEIVRQRLAGASWAAIAARMGMKHSSVRYICLSLPELFDFEAQQAAEKDARSTARLRLAEQAADLRDAGLAPLDIARRLSLRRGVADVERLLCKVS